MTEPDDRRVLQAYRAASVALDEAPAEDTRAAILAAAARATAARPQPLGRPRSWRLPLAAAASVLVGTIAVLLATQVERQAPVERAETIAAAPAAPGAKVAADTDARKEAETESSPPVSEAPVAAARGKAPARPQQDRESAPATTAAPAAASPAPAATEASALPAPPAPAVAGRGAAVRDAAPATTAKAEEAKDSVRPPAASAPSPDAGAARENEPQRGQLAAAPAARPAARAAGEARSDSASAPWRATPEAWIERIVLLRGEGRHGEADRELAALRERHPDLRVPPAALPAADR